MKKLFFNRCSFACLSKVGSIAPPSQIIIFVRKAPFCSTPSCRRNFFSKLITTAKRGPHAKSIFEISDELRRIVTSDPSPQLLDDLANHPSDIGIVAALAVSAAIVKVPQKPLEAIVIASKPWYRKTSFRDAARSIRSASTGISGGSSPRNSFKTKPVPPSKYPLYHHRVSSLKDESKSNNGNTNMANSNSQSVPAIQSKINTQMTKKESFASTITSHSTDSSLVSPSSLERLPPEEKTLKIFKREEIVLTSSEVKLSRPDSNLENRERAVFDIGSDEEDDDEQRNDFDDVKIEVKTVETTCHVTLINTLLNANMHKTSEGNAIRKQLASDPAKLDESNPLADVFGAPEPRVFNEQHPILTIEPPSPMPSFSLPNHPSYFSVDNLSTNTDVTSDKFQASLPSKAETYGCTNKSQSSFRRTLLGDANTTVTFARKETAQAASHNIKHTPTNCNKNTCNFCNFAVNKNKLTVPVLFDLVSLNFNKLTGERKACQRSHSTSGHDEKFRTDFHGANVRCASLSPANSFRAILTKPPLIHVLTNASSSSSSIPSSSGFHRSMEGDLGPAYVQKFDDLPPRAGTCSAQELDPNRPSPDQDMGCSPRG